MNILIIMVPTEFGCYTVDVPYVYITGATFDSLWEYICNAMSAAKTFKIMEDKLEPYTKAPELILGKLKIEYGQLLRGGIIVYRLKDWLNINNTRKDSESVDWSNFKCEV